MMKFHDSSDFTGLSGKLIDECKSYVDEVTVYLLNTCANKFEKNYVNIKVICSNPQRQGYGTKGMHLLCSAADKYGATLIVKPEYGSNNKWLRKFYGKFNFNDYTVNEEITKKLQVNVNKKQNKINEIFVYLVLFFSNIMLL